MWWVILTVLLSIGFTIGVLMAFFGSTSDAADELGSRPMGIAIAVLAVIIFVALSLGMSFHRLGTGEVALVYSFSGELTGSKVEPGIINTWPWEHIEKENVQIQREEFDLNSGNSAVSSDQQPIFARIALNYEVDPADVVNLYKNVGPSWKAKLIDSRVLQTFKEVTATFTAQEMTSKRQQLRTDTKDQLQRELQPYSVRVVDFFISNLGYSEAYSASIQEKNKQVQQTLRAQAKIAQAQAEAEQKVKTAQGDAEATLTKAKADAAALRLKGQALKSNPEVLRLNALEKLSANADIIICSGTCPSFLPRGG